MTGLHALPTDSQRPTLKTIAAETGLAIATVFGVGTAAIIWAA